MWVLIPIALGLIGFYVIGPRIGGVPAFKKSAESLKGIIKEKSAKADTESEARRTVHPASEPEVEVSVEPALQPVREPARSHRRRTRTPRRPVVVHPSDEPFDPAGVDGMSTPRATPRPRRKPRTATPPPSADTADAGLRF